MSMLIYSIIMHSNIFYIYFLAYKGDILDETDEYVHVQKK